jgi:hypothetical protein
MNISACGLKCDECQFYNKECKGCFATTGKPFWTADVNTPDICPLFDCSVNSRNLKNCGGCGELPCNMFVNLKDPNSTDAEHQESIQKRIKILRN